MITGQNCNMHSILQIQYFQKTDDIIIYKYQLLTIFND